MLSPDQVLAAAPIIALALFALAILLMLVAFRLFRRSRTDSFWRRRRAASQQGGRVLVVSGIMLIFSAATCAMSTFGPRLLNRAATPTEGSAVAIAPTDDLTLTAIFIPTSTVLPSETPTVVVATATDLPSLTPIPPTATTPPSSVPTLTATETSVPPTTTPTKTATEMPVAPLTINTATASRTSTATNEPPTATLTITFSVTPTTVPPTATNTATIVPTTAIPPSATYTVTPSPTSTSTFTLTPEPTITPTPVPPTATATLTPSETLTETPTMPPTITPTTTPTITPTLITIFQPPQLFSSVTPSSNSKMNITAITSKITADLKPVDPSVELPMGITRVYFFVEFSEMQPGVLWRRELRNDDDVLMSNTYLWGQAQNGTTFFYFGQPNGFGRATTRSAYTSAAVTNRSPLPVSA